MVDYVDRYVAFIDILGFKEHVKSLDQDHAKLERLLTILGSLEEHYPGEARRLAEREGLEGFYCATAFSDNIVLSCRDDFAGLIQLLTTSSTLCMHLLSQGVYARGGISKGKLHHSGNVVVGMGLINAYELESKTAYFPRVVLAPEIVDAAKHASFGHPFFTIGQDFDGLHFLDYSNTGVVPGFCKDPDNHFLALARQEIIQTLTGPASLAVKSKAGWLARFLNARAKELEMEPIPLKS